MAKRENFNDLISSIQEAFLQVNKMSELQHLDMIKNYFDENNNPICIDINYPYFDEKGLVSYHKVSIPKLCLVPMSSLKLSEVSVDFKVKLYGKIHLKESGDAENKTNNSENKLLKSSASKMTNEKSYLGYIPGGFGIRKDNDDSYAVINLKFESQEPPEGLMRINDEMIKIML